MGQPSLRQRRISREISPYWQSFCWALLLCAAAGALLLALKPDAAGIFLFGLYSIPTNSMLPLPHEPGLLYFAKYYHPFWIALAGTLGTAVVAFADYDVVERALTHPRIRSAQGTRVYRWAVRWLMARPFITIVLFSATPLPIYVVRVLAPASGYPLRRYIAALMVGRFPRFYLFAWLGYLYPIPTWVLVVMFVVLIASVLLVTNGDSAAEEAAGEKGQDREGDKAGELLPLSVLHDTFPPSASSSSQIPVLK